MAEAMEPVSDRCGILFFDVSLNTTSRANEIQRAAHVRTVTKLIPYGRKNTHYFKKISSFFNHPKNSYASPYGHRTPPNSSPLCPPWNSTQLWKHLDQNGLWWRKLEHFQIARPLFFRSKNLKNYHRNFHWKSSWKILSWKKRRHFSISKYFIFNWIFNENFDGIFWDFWIPKI